MFLKVIDLAQNINDLLYGFANYILDFMTYEILDMPVYAILFGSYLITYLAYKIALAVVIPN